MRKLSLIKRQIKVFIKASIQQELAFRFNFTVKILNSIVQLAGSVGGILILFSIKSSINGWSFYETLTVTGIFMLLQSIKDLFIAPSLSSISGLGGELWTGEFDFTLLKPVPTQLYMSMKHWSLMSSVDMVVSIVILCIAVVNLEATQTAGSILLFVLCLFIALLILYSIMLILSSAAFWYLGTPLLWVLDSIMELGRYPVKIYPLAFSNILTWVIPIGIMITIPAEVLIGSANVNEILFGFLVAITLYTLAVVFLKGSIKKYASASS